MDLSIIRTVQNKAAGPKWLGVEISRKTKSGEKNPEVVEVLQLLKPDLSPIKYPLQIRRHAGAFVDIGGRKRESILKAYKAHKEA